MSLSIWTTQTRALSSLVTSGLALAGLSMFTLTAAAQEAAPKPIGEYIGVQECVACHNQEVKAGQPAGGGLTALALNRELCALDEIRTFESKDKHIKAFELLKGELGQKMEKILGYKVTEDKRCLACHANWHWKEGFEKPQLFEFGVTCESCHGPASKWKDPHVKLDWRKTNPGDKEKDAGFVDVRNPIRRARQCFSCHIGDVKEGKVVTHEMYAAGHPPLPGIEMETFVSQMPFHWRTLRERGDFTNRAEYLKANFPGQEKPEEDLPRTKSTLIGGVMALREALDLFGEQAVDKHQDSVWPELAVFDCSACHHDLRAKSWRRVRGYGKAIPGRPQFFAWPTALVKVAIRHRAGADDAEFKKQWDEFAAKYDALRTVLDKQPFGDRQQVHTITHGENGIVPWLDKLADDIFKSKTQAPEAKLALQTLVSLEPTDYPDFHSARQTIWAIRTIRSELSVDYPKFKPIKTGGEKETIKEAQERSMANLLLFREWEQGPKMDSLRKTDEVLSGLEFSQKLRLKLPAGVDYVIADQLPDALNAVADYDPEWFRAQLAKLAKEMKTE